MDGARTYEIHEATPIIETVCHNAFTRKTVFDTVSGPDEPLSRNPNAR